MKKACLLFGLMSTVFIFPLYADNVTRSEALKQAQAFAAKRGLSVSLAPVGRQMSKSKLHSNDAALYFFDTEGDNGFVIVSGDDRTDAILGYTTAGHYDEALMPENMKAWLDGYVEQISAMAPGMSYCAYSKAVSTHPTVEPFVETKWGQYSAASPDGQSVAGCVAVAMAQAVYCYRQPVDLPAIEGYRYQLNYGGGYIKDIVIDNLPGVKGFDWNGITKVFSIYINDDPASSADPVNVLMRYCGQSVKMLYAGEASSAMSSSVPSALHKWGYGQAECIKRNDYAAAEWDDIIYNEIARQRPVIYSGMNAYNGGHSFICDGYDGNGFYHFNWGWRGYGDCYCALDVCLSSTDTDPNDGFAYSQDAVVGIYPTTETLPIKTTVLQFDYDEAHDGLNCYFWNNGGVKSDFDLGLLYEDASTGNKEYVKLLVG